MKKPKLCIVGLGYVGLSLAVLFAKKYFVIGYDIKHSRIEELKRGFDRTGQVKEEELRSVNIIYTNQPANMSEAEIIIITVPTPVDEHKVPDLKPLFSATKTVGKHMKKGVTVIYEATVYPGLTEEECVLILEKESAMVWKKDFFVGYSPERVNPGDEMHTIEKIVKIVAGDTQKTTETLAELYSSVIKAGVYISPDIKTAEAAKVIENIQRDINIALMNELSIVFNKMSLDTKAVFEAAATKWNFIRFEPGLVGGHCIGVDPYYFTFKAQALGYHPEVILAGRKMNDYMGKYVAKMTIKKIIQAGKTVKGSKVLLLGFTYKENTPDVRNTKVIDIYKELLDYGLEVYTNDPFAYKDEVKEQYSIDLLDDIDSKKPYDVIILAVKHKYYLEKFSFERFKELMSKNLVLIDVKGVYNKQTALEHGFLYWSL